MTDTLSVDLCERFGTAWKMNSAGKVGLGNILGAHRLAATKAADERVRVLQAKNERLRQALKGSAHWLHWCIHNHYAPDSTAEEEALREAHAALAEAGGRHG